ncbi:trihelix transcription factor ASIL2 [Andrographis paniculata]|uniref:trihelix transcription factor ASIL2 n=1 Tax=Andrographis paniculata TaxID=175694 RepID=UPI0021E95821|nr:trihelix transcription factor ASIL2 [Andrographis paniculata]
MERSSDHHHHHRPKQSPRKISPQTPILISSNNNNNNTERVKRDEWSEGAISSLLEAYEAKWTLRNRAKLKGHDWEDVARHVSARSDRSKSVKTQTQCKNKIESMKKRYRSESAAASALDAPSWPLYSRLHLLLRGNAAVAGVPPHPGVANATPPIDSFVPPPPPEFVVQTAAVPATSEPPQNSQGSNAKGAENNGGGQPLDQVSEKNPTDDTGSSTPQQNPNPNPNLKAGQNTGKEERRKKSGGMAAATTKRRREDECWAIGESIRWIAEAMVRSEEARLETMREIERMRAEAEEKRGEMDLRRTEIIANTQLEIARLFAAAAGGPPPILR